MTLLDETGNSLNDFFVSYMNQMSGQGGGKWGANSGFLGSSSTKPYKNGYAAGKKVIIEQIFAEFVAVEHDIETFFDVGGLVELLGQVRPIAVHHHAVTPEFLRQVRGQFDLETDEGLVGAFVVQIDVRRPTGRVAAPTKGLLLLGMRG